MEEAATLKYLGSIHYFGDLSGDEVSHPKTDGVDGSEEASRHLKIRKTEGQEALPPGDVHDRDVPAVLTEPADYEYGYAPAVH